jgi:hypothetical protein
MNKMFLKESLDIAIVVGTDVALLEMVDPVTACILDMWRNILVQFASIYFSSTSSWYSKIAYVASQMI